MIALGRLVLNAMHTVTTPKCVSLAQALSLTPGRHLYVQLPTPHLHVMSNWQFKLNIVKAKPLIPALPRTSPNSLPHLIKGQPHFFVVVQIRKPCNPL